MKNYFGHLQLQSDQREPVLVTTDGEEIPLNTSKKPDVPLGETLSVTLDGSLLVEYRRPQMEVMAERSTHHSVAVVYSRSPDKFNDGDQEQVEYRAKKMTDIYNRAMQGHRTMSADGYLIPWQDHWNANLYHSRTWNDIERILAQEYAQTYDHIQLITTAQQGRCGLAQVRGNRSLVYSLMCPWQSNSHEDGHNLGLRHAWAGGVEYRDMKRIMGTGDGRRWYNAPHLWRLGAIDENHVAEFLPDESGQAYLAGFNTLELAVPSRADRMILLRQGGQYRYIAVALDEGQLEVYVPKPDNATTFSATDRIERLGVGQTVDVNGRLIYYSEYRDGIASVIIDGGDARKAWPEYPAIESVGFEDCAGAWGNPHWGAQGLHILPTGSPHRIRVVWVTWDYDHKPFWMAGELSISNGVATGRLDNGHDTAEATVILTGEQNGLFRAKLGHELFATPLIRVSRADASTWIEHPEDTYETREVATNGVEFGYKLKPARRVGHQRTGPDWQMKQDGVTYKVSGGMRGVRTETSMQAFPA